jgi:transposase
MKALQPNLNPEDKDLMGKLLAAGHIEHKYAVRLQTVLLRSKGKGTGEIGEFLGIHQATVRSYINRYNAYGIDALLRDKTRKPGKEPISQDIKNEIFRLVCKEKPKGETHWSCRTLAKQVGIGHNAVNQILRGFGLQPHLVSKRNYSNDPLFEEKLKDVVGLYLNPPLDAIILCVDEKSQIQALERSQPILPIIRNVPERQTVDCLRHGTTTLFAAMGMLNGKVIGECSATHKAEDFIRFLKKTNKSCAKGKVLHIVIDNLSTHKTKAVNEYIESEGGRFVLHFIPTHSSWLNLVERWFAEITSKQIRRGSYGSVTELTKAIKDYIKSWNNSGRSFKWTKTSDEIIAKINKAKSFCDL